MKEEIIAKINAGIKDSGYDALLVFGSDNVQYMTGAYLHFPVLFPDRYMALFWPKEEAATCIIPHIWESSFLNLSWVTKTSTYSEKPGSPSSIVEIVVNLVKNTVRKTGKIGVDVNRVPMNLYSGLVESLDEYTLVPCDDFLRKLRIVKTPQEMELLQEVAGKIDHAIAGQAHHVLVVQAASEMSNGENIRIHAIERELDEVGQHAVAQATSGGNAAKWWMNPPMYGIGFNRVPKQHEWMRMELVATVNGYWGNGARMLAMGEPTDAQNAAFNSLIALREAARIAIKPEVKCSEVYAAVKKRADEKGITIEPNLVLGAGVGVTNFEPPYVSAVDETVLKPGMFIVLNPVVHGAGGELLMSKDTFLVTEDGCRIVGWWKDWREPFICNYTY